MPARRTRTRNPRPPRPSALAAPGGGRPSLLRALRHPNYRLFFGGQSISLVGTWVTRVAQSWLVYRLTGSAAMLGVVGFVGQVPTFVLSPFAGVWWTGWTATACWWSRRCWRCSSRSRSPR